MGKNWLSGIYCYENLINNKKYIGQSENLERRYKEHEKNFTREINKDENSFLWRDIKRFGRENFSWYIIEYCLTSELDKKEIFYIKRMNSHISENGYNISFGGGSPRGIVKTQETRNKISKSRKGKLTGESHPLFGKHRPDDVKKAISLANKGRKFTDETRKRMVESRPDTSGKNHSQFGKKRKKSSSRYFGVTWNKKSNSWFSRITVNGNLLYLGYYINEVDAAKVFDKYVIENNLPNPLNFPDDYPYFNQSAE